MTISSLVPAREFEESVKHFPSTLGWLSTNAAQIFYAFHAFQLRNLNMSGDILEVGAHEARSSVFFTHLLREGESLHVSDLFDQQDLNISKSAGSSFAAWERNFERFKAGDQTVVIHHGPSQNLDPIALGSNFRFAYLDGGHATDEVRADLELAEAILVEGGVAVVDDTFNQDFPGTTEGVIAYCYRDDSKLVPLLCFETKVALVNKSYYETYRSMLTEMLDQGEHWFLPPQMLCGHEVLTIRFAGRWEVRSKVLKRNFPLAHQVLRSTKIAQNVFHRLRGALTDRAK